MDHFDGNQQFATVDIKNCGYADVCMLSSTGPNKLEIILSGEKEDQVQAIAKIVEGFGLEMTERQTVNDGYICRLMNAKENATDAEQSKNELLGTLEGPLREIARRLVSGYAQLSRIVTVAKPEKGRDYMLQVVNAALLFERKTNLELWTKLKEIFEVPCEAYEKAVLSRLEALISNPSAPNELKEYPPAGVLESIFSGRVHGFMTLS